MVWVDFPGGSGCLVEDGKLPVMESPTCRVETEVDIAGPGRLFELAFGKSLGRRHLVVADIGQTEIEISETGMSHGNRSTGVNRDRTLHDECSRRVGNRIEDNVGSRGNAAPQKQNDETES